MDIRQMRYFVTVAQELNFSRAAERLHISQPPLSQSIKALEDSLGVALLVRNKREVKLTDAGRVFLAKSQDILDQLGHAVDATLRAATGAEGILRIGMATSAVFHVMPLLLERLSMSFPDVTPRLTDMRSLDQIRAIKRDELDVGIIHEHPNVENLHYVSLFEEPFCLAAPSGHDMSVATEVELADCRHDTFIFFSREYAPMLHDSMVAVCLSNGFEPRIGHTARHALTMFQMVRMGLGIALVPSSFSLNATPGVIYRTLRTPHRGVRIGAVWNPQTSSDLVLNATSRLFSHPF